MNHRDSFTDNFDRSTLVFVTDQFRCERLIAAGYALAEATRTTLVVMSVAPTGATANAAAIEAEDEERHSIESSKKAVGLRGLQGSCGEQSPQMMLWEDWTNELGDIDKLVKHKDKLRLSNDQYKMIAQKLRATADEIESLIKA